jgi:ABC-type multidrug transport system ATPase subunit
MPEAAVELTDITKRFDQLTAVNGVTFDVRQGEIFGLVGPNGSGKTTLLNMVTGLLRPTSGQVRVAGLDPLDNRREVHRCLGLAPQETALYEQLTARENLAFHHALYCDRPGSAREEVERMLELMHLASRADDPVHTFSGGMKRRLALARALLHDPQLILFDEPTLGVDVQGTHVLWDKLRELRDQSKTIIVTTNVMHEAEQLCDRLAILDRGQLVVLDTPDNLKNALQDDVIELEFETPVSEAEDFYTLSEDLEVNIEDRVVHVHCQQGETMLGELVGSLARKRTIKRVELRKPTLDDVFLHHTGRSLRE